MRAISVGARHADSPVSSPGRLAIRWICRFRWDLLLLFLSDFGSGLVRRKYDAFTTDRAYANRPSGRFLVGNLIDWIILRQSLHVALRQRLEIVVAELTGNVGRLASRGANPIRIVSGPSGLARDLLMTADELGRRGLAIYPVEFWAADLDPTGDVLAEAKRRAELAGVDLSVVKADLLEPSALSQALGGRACHIFNCIGLACWLDLNDVGRLLSAIHGQLVTSGVLLIDNFHAHSQSKFGPPLEIATRYHPEREFEAAICVAGFEIERRLVTGNKIAVVYVARKCV